MTNGMRGNGPNTGVNNNGMNFDEVFSTVPVTAPATPDTSEFVTKSELADIRKMLEDLTAQLK